MFDLLKKKKNWVLGLNFELDSLGFFKYLERKKKTRKWEESRNTKNLHYQIQEAKKEIKKN